jgi:type VI secretion system secreted protein VgrG
LICNTRAGRPTILANVISPVQYQFECGDFDWRVRAIVVEERLSEPFCAELRLVAEAAGTPELLGVPARITIIRDEVAHVFVGEVTRAEASATANGAIHARVRVEPRLVRARRATKYRIFQNVTVVEIVRELLGPAGDCDFEVVLDRERDGRDYCVQYGESDLQFAMRLLEDEGIAWFLDCSGERPVMHLVEAQRGFPQIAIAEPELLLVPDQAETADVESIQAITIARRAASPGVSARSWSWLLYPEIHEQAHPPEATLPWSEVIDPRRLCRQYELMNMPECDEATRASAQVEHERMACRDIAISGTSNVSALAVGTHFRFDVGLDEPQPLLVLAVRHRGDCPEVEVHGTHRSGPNYTNTFECQPLLVPHRPQRRIAVPRIHSLHTALVTGPAGEEIHTDTWGRIMVRMHWDRSGSAPELASCWLRVAQMWSGAGWGSMFIPRVGMEVLVAFIDGDPDRPLCVGCVYNGDHPPPYEMPTDRTKSTIRTQSSPGGKGHNELTFEDAAGSEEVYLRAQRNLRTQVLANETRSVGADQTIGVGRDQALTIDGDQRVTIKGNQTVGIEGGGEEGLAGSKIEIKGSAEITVTDPGNVLIDAAECIILRVGGSTITIEDQAITFVSGGGTRQVLDETAVTLSKRGSLLRIADSVRLHAVAGGVLEMDDRTTILGAATGASVVLTDSAALAAALGAKLDLGTDAALGGASIVATAAGSKLKLDTDAILEGAQVSCSSAGGSMSLSATGAAIDGTTVDLTAAATASVVAAMVKIN